MPIYEYRCPDCSQIFEKIMWNTDKEPITCPCCKGANPIRILSAFAKGGSGSIKGLSASSGCGPAGGGFS